jgi:hypothetical protein
MMAGVRWSKPTLESSMLLRAFLVLPLLAAAAPSDGPAGRYRLAGGPDTAAEIVLNPDGRFEFGLAEGALDASATGRWTREGGHILLTTDPKPVAPVVSAGPVARSADASLSLKVVWPDGRGVALVDFRIRFADGSVEEGYTQDYGWSLPPGDARVPRSVELAVPMYGLASPAFALDASQGNAFSFVLSPNDLGRVDFSREPLDIGERGLVMHHNGAAMTFLREPGGRDPD